jgi:3',5'-nucleoside bisphosphate phosphatase
MRILNDCQPGTFDLHMHTTASDGIYSPKALVRKAKDCGLRTIAITDHDTLAGVDEAVSEGKAVGMDVIPGVEISTRYHGKGIDVLGYNIQDCLGLHNALASFREERKTRARRIIQRFEELGMPITLEDVKAFSQNGVIARPHIAKAIVAKGYVSDVQTVFDRYLADGKPAAVQKEVISTDEAVRWIKEAGGQAVLAHPVLLHDNNLVKQLLTKGFDGIEVWHRHHRAADVQRYLDMADQYNLLVTGGSDFHSDEHTLGQFMPDQSK